MQTTQCVKAFDQRLLPPAMAWFSEPHTQEGQVVEAIRSVFIALLLWYACCCYYWSSNACSADVTPCYVQIRGPSEMINHTDTRSGTRLNTRVQGPPNENRRGLPSRILCCNCCCSPSQKTCTEQLTLAT